MESSSRPPCAEKRPAGDGYRGYSLLPGGIEYTALLGEGESRQR